jgi:FtsH-binding integral membrane protein
MNWKHTLGAGAGIGATLATLIVLFFMKFGIDPGSFLGLFVIFFVMAVISAFIMNQILQVIGYPNQSLKQLIPIGFLTTIIPLLGVSFGAPNSDLTTLAQIILIGTVGGIFWSTPFSAWNYYKNSGEINIGDE